MEILGCGHAQIAAPTRLCSHLVGVKRVNHQHFEHARCLRGVGVEYDAACESCAAGFRSGESVEWIEVCDLCCDDVVKKGSVTWVGEVGILEQPTAFDATLIEHFLPPDELKNEALFALAQDGRIFAWTNGELREVGAVPQSSMHLELPAEPEASRTHIHLVPRLKVSSSGRFASLINDFGRYGVVVDLATRAVTMHLERGGYHSQQTPFPFAFFSHGGVELVVHGTDWNRLDVSNPQTGQLLSVRESPVYQRDQRPIHYLDYFHGRLHVSPSEEWILDDGWVWGSSGHVTTWSLKRWMEEDVWESEDGPSRTGLIEGESWNLSMCWIGNNRFAYQGLEEDDQYRLAAVRIFGINSQETIAFAGPEGEFFSDGTRLFSVGDNGLSIWNVETGARTGRIEGFKPQFQISGALIEIEGQKLRRWNYDVAL